MAASNWLDYLKSAKKTAFVQDDKRKVHYAFPDGSEMAEDYSLKTDDLLVRQWRKKGTLGNREKWEIEMGDLAAPANLDSEGLMESASNPVFVRKDKRKGFQWRIRNLPYAIDNYSVDVDEGHNVIIVRTKNKKYYKKFNIPDMDRAGLNLDPSALNFAHANNTLVIQYEKPEAILQQEAMIIAELKKLKTMKDSDMDCKQS